MKISIVTPSYNQVQFIERTIQSVIAQKSSDYEIEHVIFDGGSLDGTVDILEKYKDFVKWVSEKDQGQTHAVNKGIRSTDGEIIGWLNSDDIYYPNAISKVVDYFKENPDVNVLYGAAEHIDTCDHPFENYPTEIWDFERLKQTCFICQPALFFRRKLVKEYGELDENLNFCMDYEYWLRLGKAGVKFCYTAEKLAGSRLYETNKTIASRVKVHYEINQMLKKKFNVVPDEWLFNYAHAVVDTHSKKGSLLTRKIYLIFLSIYFALIWNKKISQKMLFKIKDWF